MVKRTQQIQVYFLTFLCYVAVHSSRSIWSISKPNFQEETHVEKYYLGLMDLCFLFVYALTTNFGSFLGDKFNLKVYITLGMFLASLFLAQIPIFYHFFGNKVLWLLPIFMALNGFCQSTQWPGLIKVMSFWFSNEKRGLFMGIWSGCANVGNIVGYWIGYITFHQLNQNWECAIFLTCLFYAFCALVGAIFLKTQPDEKKSEEDLLIQETTQTSMEAKCSYWELWSIPGVYQYALCYFCLKSCQYGFLFWLPTYIDYQGISEWASSIATLFDIATFTGGILIGYVSDTIRKRALIMFPSLVIASCLCVSIKFYLTNQVVWYFVLLFLLGVTLGGPYGLVSGVVAIDLAQQPSLKNRPNMQIALSGLIEGTGSFGAALLQAFIATIETDYLFWVFFVLCVAASLIILPFAYRDLQQVQKRQNKSNLSDFQV